MTEELKLATYSRDEKKEKAKELRSNNFIPAVVYGSGKKNRNIKVKALDFEKLFTQAGETNLVDLMIDREKPIKVVVYEVDKDPVKDSVIHVDFYQVDMNKEITVEIPLSYVGEAKAVKELGGILVKNASNVEAECLPDKLVSKIEVDLSRLENIDDSIKMSDLNLPEGIKLTSQTNEILAIVVEQKVEAEVKPEEVPAAAEAEVKPEEVPAAAEAEVKKK